MAGIRLRWILETSNFAVRSRRRTASLPTGAWLIHFDLLRSQCSERGTKPTLPSQPGRISRPWGWNSHSGRQHLDLSLEKTVLDYRPAQPLMEKSHPPLKFPAEVYQLNLGLWMHLCLGTLSPRFLPASRKQPATRGVTMYHFLLLEIKSNDRCTRPSTVRAYVLHNYQWKCDLVVVTLIALGLNPQAY